jgi:hypothetical protein
LIENVGCTASDTTQENHVLFTTGGVVTPKNIVIRTQGSASTFGSFLRDDSITLPKGNVRGSGANDLSVSREQCAQVASGEFSSILGGKNNTASASLSIVVGGSDNSNNSINGIIVGGLSNLNQSDRSVIISGSQNSNLSGGTGYNFIGNGVNNVNRGSFNVIINGINNNIQDSSFNSIVNGSNNSIGALSSNSLIGAGISNSVTGLNNSIVAGVGNTATGFSGGNFIGAGTRNIVSGFNNAIIVGQNNIIDPSNTTFNIILAGSNNNIQSNVGNSMIGAGEFNIVRNSDSAVICGISNTITVDGSGGNFIGGGITNIVSGGYNSILGGNSNRIDSSSISFSAILGGQRNGITGTSVNVMIGTGDSNTVTGTDNAIIAGQSNQIQAGGSGGNFIGTGVGNLVVGSYNGILCGSGNRIDNTLIRNCAIMSGAINSITSNSTNSMIGAGSNNRIIDGFSSAIIAGFSNFAGGTANFIGAGVSGTVTGTANAIIAGSNNIINNTQAIFNAILAGSNNSILSGISNSIIGAGFNNNISANNAGIFGGNNNRIDGPTGIFSAIGGGTSNVISIGNSFVCGQGLELTQTDYPSAAFGVFNLQGSTGAGATAGNRIFMVGNGTNATTGRRNAFSVNDKGLCVANASFSTGGADFAEYFESHTIYSEKFESGESVCMIDQRFIGKNINSETLQFEDSLNGFSDNDLGKIMLSKDVPSEIEPFGVVVKNSGFIGNAYEEEWKNKFEKDILGNAVYVPVTVESEIEETNITYQEIENVEIKSRVNSDGEIEFYQEKQTQTVPIVNVIMQDYKLYDENNNFIGYIQKPKIKRIYKTIYTQNISSNYNPNLPYIPRSERPEWNLVALLGQVTVKSERRPALKWTKMKQIDTNYTNYFIK